jgi:hypothetical protein
VSVSARECEERPKYGPQKRRRLSRSETLQENPRRHLYCWASAYESVCFRILSPVRENDFIAETQPIYSASGLPSLRIFTGLDVGPRRAPSRPGGFSLIVGAGLARSISSSLQEHRFSAVRNGGVPRGLCRPKMKPRHRSFQRWRGLRHGCSLREENCCSKPAATSTRGTA